MIGALLVGVVVMVVARPYTPAFGLVSWAQPVWTAPVWSLPAMFELVVPLSITVLVVQNAQGLAVLRANGHEPPINAISNACGVWSMLGACVGAVSTCLTGPVNAILTTSGAQDRQWAGGMVVGVMAIGFGLWAPLFTQAALATPLHSLRPWVAWLCCAYCKPPLSLRFLSGLPWGHWLLFW